MSPSRTCATWPMPDMDISEPCATRCAASPCTGTPICGRTHSYILRNSLRRGWPDTCTSASPSSMIFMPRSISRFLISRIAFSLPGMVREENTTVSPAVSATDFISSRESFASAASGSPWLPVQMITRFSRGM